MWVGDDPDGWNQEDLSIWSADQVVGNSDQLDAGARALAGYCRPYVRAAQGTLLQQTWNGFDLFECTINVQETIEGFTEIFVPFQFRVSNLTSSGNACIWEQESSLVKLRLADGVVTLTVPLRIDYHPNWRLKASAPCHSKLNQRPSASICLTHGKFFKSGALRLSLDIRALSVTDYAFIN